MSLLLPVLPAPGCSARCDLQELLSLHEGLSRPFKGQSPRLSWLLPSLLSASFQACATLLSGLLKKLRLSRFLLCLLHVLLCHYMKNRCGISPILHYPC